MDFQKKLKLTYKNKCLDRIKLLKTMIANNYKSLQSNYLHNFNVLNFKINNPEIFKLNKNKKRIKITNKQTKMFYLLNKNMNNKTKHLK